MSNCSPINIYNNVSGGSSYESDNIGSGVGLFAGESVAGNTTTFEFKSLVAGTNVNLSSDSETITISSIDTGVDTLNNVGGFAAVGQSIVGDTINLRTIQGTGGTTVTQNTNDVQINTPVVANLPAAGQQILAGVASNEYQLRTLLSGSGVGVSTTGNNITFSTTSPLITGVNNLGTPGARVLANITGGVINARSLRTTGPGLTIAESLNNIDFTVPAYSIASAPGGSSLVASGFTNAVIRSVIAGTAMSLNSTANSITFNSSAANTVTNLGTLPGHEDVLVDVLSNSTRAKSLQPNGNIQISSDANHIYFRPLTNVTIPYSGRSILNTYPSGNPELADFLGFGNSVTVTSLDQTPATYTALPNAFIGWQSPYRAEIINVTAICRFSIPTVITEQLDIYCIIHRGKENDTGLDVVHFERVFTTNVDIAVGDTFQVNFNPTASIDTFWHLYLSFYALRVESLGNQNPVEFYTSGSMTLVTSDVL